METCWEAYIRQMTKEHGPVNPETKDLLRDYHEWLMKQKAGESESDCTPKPDINRMDSRLRRIERLYDKLKHHTHADATGLPVSFLMDESG